jgi:hypothetical protein
MSDRLNPLARCGPDWQRGPPAEEAVVNSLLTDLHPDLPREYLLFLTLADGGEGELWIWPGWFIIWAAATVAERNRDYEVQDRYPGFIAFGSNGGLEMFAFDMRHPPAHPVVALPYIGLSVEEAMPVAPDFLAFVKHLGHMAKG